MQEGKYRVIKPIHVYDCIYGQLKLGLGVIVTIEDYGRAGVVGDYTFPAQLLQWSEGS